MAKKTWMYVLTMVCIAVLLSGCGNSPSKPEETKAETENPPSQTAAEEVAEIKEPVTLKLMAMSTGDGNPEYDALIGAFQESYPWITIEAEYLGIGDTYTNSLITRLKGNNPPDLFHVASGVGSAYSALLLSEAGYVMDLGQESWAEGLVPDGDRENWWLGDALTAIPLQVAPIIVEYNVAAFEELGIKVPETMAEFFEAGRKSLAQGQNFLVLSGAHTGHSVHVMISIAMGTVYAENPDWNQERYDGKVTFAQSAGWQQAVRYFMQMCDEGLLLPGSAGMTTDSGHLALANGEGIARVVPAGNIHIVEAINDEIELSTFVMPGETADKRAVSGMTADGIAAFSNPQHPEEIKLFMDFMVLEGGLNTYTEITGNIAIGDFLTGTVRNEKLKCVQPLIAENRMLSHPQIAWPAAAYDALGTGVQSLIVGIITPEEYLAALDQAWDDN